MNNTRHRFDRYDSPAWFLSHLAGYIGFSGILADPCVGGGNLSRFFPCLSSNFHWTNDIDESADADYHLDATNPNSWFIDFPPVDWVITNPPFNEAYPILANAWSAAKIGVVFFVRLTFLEPTNDRAEFLFTKPPYLVNIYPRFKFRKSSKNNRWQADTATICAVVWRKDVKRGLGVRTIPKTDILGFHDNPENAPSLINQVEHFKIMQHRRNVVLKDFCKDAGIEFLNME